MRTSLGAIGTAARPDHSRRASRDGFTESINQRLPAAIDIPHIATMATLKLLKPHRRRRGGQYTCSARNKAATPFPD